MIEIKQKEPKLRFSDFDGVWKLKNIEELFDRVKNPVQVIGNQEYQQIGIRSHGKGIFYNNSTEIFESYFTGCLGMNLATTQG